MELIRQQDKNDCGVANCVMIVNHFQNVKTTIEDFKIAHNYKREEYTLDQIKDLLVNYSIDIEYFEIESLNNIIDANSFPILLVVKNSLGLNHYVTINNYENGVFEVYDPSFNLKRKLTIKKLKEISLNIVGFIKKSNKYKEQQKLASFNIKYFKRFWLLFKTNWQMFALVNLITVVSLFSFFFSNMFIKVLLTEYAYLTIKRAVLIVSMFIGIITLWAVLAVIQRRLTKWNDQRSLYKYLSYLDTKYDLAKVNKSFNKEQQLRELNDLLTVTRQQLYLINNFLGFSLFTVAVIYLTASVSYILLIGTLLLMIVLSILKVWQAKRNHINLQSRKIYGNKTGHFIANTVNSFSTINQKISLSKYLELNKEYLSAPNLKDNSLINYLEKISIYLYYFVMIFCLYTTGLDISLFLVITNITFVFSHQLEVILTNINSSFLVNRKMKIINSLEKVALTKNEPSVNSHVTIKKTKVKNNVFRVKALKDVLIDYYQLEKYYEAKQVFDASLDLVQSETASNNLFNFGENNGLENYSKFKLDKWIDELNIDLSLQTFYLNAEQQEFIKVASSLFTNKPVIVLKKSKSEWFLHLERDMKKYIKDKLVIIYE